MCLGILTLFPTHSLFDIHEILYTFDILEIYEDTYIDADTCRTGASERSFYMQNRFDLSPNPCSLFKPIHF